jgi:hypothetical protein
MFKDGAFDRDAEISTFSFLKKALLLNDSFFVIF